MIFTEFRFFVFFAVVFAVAWFVGSNRVRKGWLLLCSYAFYAAWDWRFLSLILLSTAVDYEVGHRLEESRSPRHRRALLVLSLCVNLGVLGFFKYFNFFVDSAIDLFGILGIPMNPWSLRIILPVGISFYTFQTLSYSIDIYRCQIHCTRDRLDFALFVAFFPQLVAGPIMRARDFLPQLAERPRFSTIRFRPALLLFLIGFFKKACVADNLAPYVDALYADPMRFDSISAWIATLLYSVQVYCDFSGYSDMAIACAAMLGYRLCVNFQHPYFSSGLLEFWSRWHVSLSSWLRDYVYIPLGGSRHGEAATLCNLMTTMVLVGLWHGAAWTYVVFGFIHGVAMSVERLWRARASGTRAERLFDGAAGALATFLFFNITLVIFRSPDFATAWIVLRSMLGFAPGGGEALSLSLAVIFGVLVGLHALSYRRPLDRFADRGGPFRFALAYGAAAALCLALVPIGYRPFIYFQF